MKAGLQGWKAEVIFVLCFLKVFLQTPEVGSCWCSTEKLLSKILKNSLENICAEVLFYKVPGL